MTLYHIALKFLSCKYSVVWQNLAQKQIFTDKIMVVKLPAQPRFASIVNFKVRRRKVSQQCSEPWNPRKFFDFKVHNIKSKLIRIITASLRSKHKAHNIMHVHKLLLSNLLSYSTENYDNNTMSFQFMHYRNYPGIVLTIVLNIA